MSKQDLKLVIDSITNNDVPEFKPIKNVRNACVAAIIRWRPYVLDNIVISEKLASSGKYFLNQSWVNDCHGEAEILFIKRALRPGDFWSGHIAFPGGKDEPSDRNSLDTVIRECQEEIGINLGSNEFISLGTLKHRSITGKESSKLRLTLVPHIFLQVTPITPEFTIQPKEVAETYWISIRYLLQDPIVAYDPMVNTMVRPGEKLPWPESVRVPAISLNTKTFDDDIPHLWGMTLRMTQEILGMELSPHTIMSAEDVKKFDQENERKKRNQARL